MGTASVALKGDAVKQDFIGTIEIVIEATINVDARTAQRKVTGWVVSEVANLMGGMSPRLFIGKRTLWRVPVVLTASKQGVVGQVGTVDVDAETGELLVNEALKEQMLKNAEALVS
jgi:hypothetical protein